MIQARKEIALIAFLLMHVLVASCTGEGEVVNVAIKKIVIKGQEQAMIIKEQQDEMIEQVKNIERLENEKFIKSIEEHLKGLKLLLDEQKRFKTSNISSSPDLENQIKDKIQAINKELSTRDTSLIHEEDPDNLKSFLEIFLILYKENFIHNGTVK